MAEVHQGRVEYESSWEVQGGKIMLTIQKAEGVYKGEVVITYVDTQSIAAKMQNDLDDI